MAKLWLPIKDPSAPRKEVILYIPGASQMDQGQLKAILQKYQETVPAEIRAQGPSRPRFSKAEVAGALREFQQFVERKRKNR